MSYYAVDLVVCANPSSSSSSWVWVTCFFWYRLTRVVPDRGPLNMYVYCRDGHSVCLLLAMYDSSFLFIVRLRDTNFKWMVFIVRNYSLSYLVQLAVIPALNWLMHLLAQLVYAVPKDFCFTSVAYFFIFAFSLTLRSQNQCMDTSWTNSWGYGVVLVSHDWILHLVPLEGHGEIAPNFAKNLMVPLFTDLF